MNLKLVFSVVVVLLSSMILVGQTKDEREERIKPNQFPLKAQKIINQIPNGYKRLKFYKETDGKKLSYEAKFKYKKKHYSLEFSENGDLEDIEVTIKLKSINDTIKNNIKSYFKDSYSKYKFIKIQKQFIYNCQISPSKFLLSVLSQDSDLENNYEIVAEIKSEGKREVREFILDKNGTFLNYRTLKPTSYEHVLY